MGEVLALQQHRHAELLGQPRTDRHRCWSPGIGGQQAVQALMERRIGPSAFERRLELSTRRHEALGDEPPAELAKTSKPFWCGEGRVFGGHSWSCQS